MRKSTQVCIINQILSLWGHLVRKETCWLPESFLIVVFLLSSNVFKPLNSLKCFEMSLSLSMSLNFFPKSLNLTQNVRCRLTEKRRWTLWAWIHPSSTSSSSWGNPRSSRTRLWHSGVGGPREGSGWREVSGLRPAVSNKILVFKCWCYTDSKEKMILIMLAMFKLIHDPGQKSWWREEVKRKIMVWVAFNPLKGFIYGKAPDDKLN